MNRISTWLTVLVIAACPASPTLAVALTAVTLFGCDDRGEVNIAFRTNSGPIDAAWDLFLYEGPVVDPAAADPDTIRWLHDRNTHTIKIPLEPGTHTFTFHSESSRPWPVVGMNLFFDGANDRAAISVKAPMDKGGPPFPAFAPNSAGRTMGWPITDVPAAGSLTSGADDRGIWRFVEPAAPLKVTMKRFRFSVPEVTLLLISACHNPARPKVDGPAITAPPAKRARTLTAPRVRDPGASCRNSGTSTCS